MMHTCVSAAELRALLAPMRREGRRIGFVPTMGNLHAGHHSLLGIAREQADVVVASVFVNPTQFGPNEDFARYPRTPEADAAGLAAHGCDVLFLPGVDELYPFGTAQSVKVSVPQVTDVLEGAIRPGHFDGVATVVAKLFNLVQPQVAVFGRKDYQQLLVVRRMVRDLGYAIDVVGAPIVREANGLAMSSRNQYLDAAQRERAGAIHAVLQRMGAGVRSGQAMGEVERDARSGLERAGLVPDYAVVRRADDLAEPTGTEAPAGLVALVAARLGTTRLIDNLAIDAA
ncbi:pantoate--beta-alanine ligase [Dokdonella fugitiva]|jgi:pantoate--beta-alanine ligase|uniref:Pantothenate synthetase n=2 Tax=Dokdonella fugitiva TaxID=328517 RepID=A0A4R2ICB7_9GAMM|nr:pantoate--beta-alanine ligase [Dokdonella fugitiva]TCO41897.1 pantoate--beta-alanine ligase [Dokdonella fugitiva]